MVTICDYIADLTRRRAEPLDLSALEREQLETLLSQPGENMPYLDRVSGVWIAHPLSLERGAFNELCDILRLRFNMPELASRLARDAVRSGGLLTAEESRMRYAMLQRSAATMH